MITANQNLSGIVWDNKGSLVELKERKIGWLSVRVGLKMMEIKFRPIASCYLKKSHKQLYYLSSPQVFYLTIHAALIRFCKPDQIYLWALKHVNSRWHLFCSLLCPWRKCCCAVMHPAFYHKKRSVHQKLWMLHDCSKIFIWENCCDSDR